MYFVIFTATTATFGVNILKYNKLRGGSRGGSRVTTVAVKAVFCPKIIHFLIKTGDFHSKIVCLLCKFNANHQICDKNSPFFISF